MTDHLDAYADLGDVLPLPVARVETHRSIWLVDDATYVRMPKDVTPDSTRDVASP